MNAFLIDPFTGEITIFEWDGLLSTVKEALEVKHLDAAMFSKGVLYVSDTGMLDELPHFWFEGRIHPFFGRALLVGRLDEQGYDTESTLTLEQVRESVTFMGDYPDFEYTGGSLTYE